ncbi:MAG: DUF4350 domain-containing protein [Microbacteriaceae bacterium]|nr:DUF4350 domain-containing protein [Microbacteriaceae bacterium]
MSTREAAVADAAQETTTPTVRRVLRRGILWVVMLVVVLLVAVLLTSMVRGSVQAGVPLAADNPAPGGAMALAEVLRDQGVDVFEAGSLDGVREAVDRADGPTTVLLWDIDLVLETEQHDDLLLLTDDLVVIEPTAFELQDLAPGIAQAGSTGGSFDADCDLPAVQAAETVTATGAAYRIVRDDVDATGCLGDGDRYALVRLERPSATVTVLGLGEALSNGVIETDGDAALALHLLGAHRTLVWYIPTFADLGPGGPTLAELTPPWVTPLAVMLLLTALGAMLWRGRRIGPVVVEDLPVVVRAGETMEGRARMYERSGDRLHALDTLRVGTLGRLARACGLPRTASVTEISDAVAALTGRDRGQVAGILIDAKPTTDAELMRLSDDLLRLEAEARERGRP